MDNLTNTGRRNGRSPRWSLRLLGGFELRALPGGESVSLPGKRERVLLAYLALCPNCRQPRRKLMTLLWGEDVDETALDNLRTCMWRLRKAIDDADHRIVASHEDNIVLDIAAFDIDVLVFRRLAAQSARSELESAASLYAGEFLAGLDIESEEFASWRRAEATRYRDQAIEALRRLMMLLGESGQAERAIETGLRLLALDPLHEDAARRVMRLYSQTGRRGAAIQLYHSLAAALRADLDTEPDAETRSVYAEITRGDEERTAAPAYRDNKRTSLYASAARPPDASTATPRMKPRIGGWIAAGGLVALLVLVLVIQFAPWAGRPVASPGAEAVSVTVLPFVNLSGDKEQDYFSDGITEEITAALAKVPDLRVVARISAFQFKGKPVVVKMLGEQLGVTHVLEGSVRKEGNRVRITVQLIKTDDTHIWSENYDRQLTDVIPVQEEIARSIAEALKVPLGLKPGENLVTNRSIDSESYQQYLRARALAQAGGRARVTEAIAQYEQVIARNPNYAPAWASLSLAYYSMVGSDPAWNNGSLDEARRVAEVYRPKMEAAAERAFQLDPNFEGAAALSVVEFERGNMLSASELLAKAIALNPNHPGRLNGYSIMLAGVGRIKEAIAVREQLRMVEPLVRENDVWTAEYLWLDGQDEAAIALLNSLPSDMDTRATTDLARIYASLGRYGEAADMLEKAHPGNAAAEARWKVAARLLRAAPAKVAGVDTLPRLGANLDWVYLYVDAPERAIQTQEFGLKMGFVAPVSLASVWHASYAHLRKTERFKAFVRALGLDDYWRAKGWPEFCHPVTGNDFECN
jgi:TolB-like protein/DNA-binding SARP family transcriptional activator